MPLIHVVMVLNVFGVLGSLSHIRVGSNRLSPVHMGHNRGGFILSQRCPETG
jgi:hypothetical protein